MAVDAFYELRNFLACNPFYLIRYQTGNNSLGLQILLPCRSDQPILPIQHCSTISNLRFSYSAFCVALFESCDDGDKATTPNLTKTVEDSFFSSCVL
jgi:hypothetical protein